MMDARIERNIEYRNNVISTFHKLNYQSVVQLDVSNLIATQRLQVVHEMYSPHWNTLLKIST